MYNHLQIKCRMLSAVANQANLIAANQANQVVVVALPSRVGIIMNI